MLKVDLFRQIETLGNDKQLHINESTSTCLHNVLCLTKSDFLHILTNAAGFFEKEPLSDSTNEPAVTGAQNFILYLKEYVSKQLSEFFPIFNSNNEFIVVFQKVFLVWHRLLIEAISSGINPFAHIDNAEDVFNADFLIDLVACYIIFFPIETKRIFNVCSSSNVVQSFQTDALSISIRDIVLNSISAHSYRNSSLDTKVETALLKFAAYTQVVNKFQLRDNLSIYADEVLKKITIGVINCLNHIIECNEENIPCRFKFPAFESLILKPLIELLASDLLISSSGKVFLAADQPIAAIVEVLSSSIGAVSYEEPEVIHNEQHKDERIDADLKAVTKQMAARLYLQQEEDDVEESFDDGFGQHNNRDVPQETVYSNQKPELSLRQKEGKTTVVKVRDGKNKNFKLVEVQTKVKNKDGKLVVSEEAKDNRKFRQQNKAKIANHNRKAGATRKSNKGMF